MCSADWRLSNLSVLKLLSALPGLLCPKAGSGIALTVSLLVMVGGGGGDMFVLLAGVLSLGKLLSEEEILAL